MKILADGAAGATPTLALPPPWGRGQCGGSCPANLKIVFLFLGVKKKI
jgi:hypothetical protein